MAGIRARQLTLWPVKETKQGRTNEQNVSLPSAESSPLPVQEPRSPPGEAPAAEDIAITVTPNVADHPINVVDRESSEEPIEINEEDIKRNKLINEEYKTWKKHAPFLYDFMLR